MHRIRRALAYLALATGLIAGIPSVAAAATTVSGQVVDGNTGLPITTFFPNPTISLVRQLPDGSVAVVDTQPTLAGMYSFSNVEAGQFRLRQEAPYAFYYFPPLANPGKLLTVDGNTPVVADWPLSRNGVVQGTSVISGTLRNMDPPNRPLTVGSVMLLQLEQQAPNGIFYPINDAWTTSTYSFTALGPGVYRIRQPGSAPPGYIVLDNPGPAAAVNGVDDVTLDWPLRATGAVLVSSPASSAWSIMLLVIVGVAATAVTYRRVSPTRIDG